MDAVRRLLDVLRALFRRPDDRQFRTVIRVPELRDVPEVLDPHILYVAGSRALPKWAVLLCPCERPHQVTLSLQPTHRHRWRVRDGWRGPSLYPSIDVANWRRCHYWVRDGRIIWVADVFA